ncbi:MAG: hypothetical protein HZC23_11530 [Rhodocyclales bacterium]|nr:hypothetical protein [Rhodocyclales bacterium]
MKHLSLALIVAALVSLLIQGAIVIMVGRPAAPWPVEVLSHPRVSFAEEARRAIFFTPDLAKTERSMIAIVGASAAQEGFQPAIAKAEAPDLLIHNLSMGGANITETDQIIDIAIKATPSQIVQRSVLVLAVSYPMFVPDSKRWSDPVFVPPDAIAEGKIISDIQREAMRCSSICDPSSLLFKYAPEWLISLSRDRYALNLRLVPRLPAHITDPILKWNLWRYDPRRKLESKRAKKSPGNASPAPDEPFLVIAHRQMDFLTKYMGQPEGVLQEEQFDKLRMLIDKAKGVGFHVVVVDMPLPSWHRQNSPFFAPYETKLRDVLASYTSAGTIDFVSLVDAIPDDEFRDSIHPNAEAASHWARILIERLRVLHRFD